MVGLRGPVRIGICDKSIGITSEDQSVVTRALEITNDVLHSLSMRLARIGHELSEGRDSERDVWTGGDLGIDKSPDGLLIWYVTHTLPFTGCRCRLVLREDSRWFEGSEDGWGLRKIESHDDRVNVSLLRERDSPRHAVTRDFDPQEPVEFTEVFNLEML